MPENVTVKSGTSKIDFDAYIRQAMSDYGEAVKDEAEETAYEVTVEATQKLKKLSPRSRGAHRGTYAKGWAHKAETTKYGVSNVIYGRKASTYAIAHLLEYGHARRGGGRTVPPAKPEHHINTVNAWAQSEFQKRLRERIEKS